VLLFSFGKEASECSGGLLPFCLVIFITYSLLSIRMSPLSYLKFIIWVYLVLVKLWSYLSTYGDALQEYCQSMMKNFRHRSSKNRHNIASMTVLDIVMD